MFFFDYLCKVKLKNIMQMKSTFFSQNVKEAEVIDLTNAVIFDQSGNDLVISENQIAIDIVKEILNGIRYYACKETEQGDLVICPVQSEFETDSLGDAIVFGPASADGSTEFVQVGAFLDGTLIPGDNFRMYGDLMAHFSKPFCWKMTEIKKDVWALEWRLGNKPDDDWVEWDTNRFVGYRVADIHNTSVGQIICAHYSLGGHYANGVDLRTCLNAAENRGINWHVMEWDWVCVVAMLVLSRYRNLRGDINRVIDFQGGFDRLLSGDMQGWIGNVIIKNRIPEVTMPDGSVRYAKEIPAGYAANGIRKMQLGKYLDLFPLEKDGTTWKSKEYWIEENTVGNGNRARWAAGNGWRDSITSPSFDHDETYSPERTVSRVSWSGGKVILANSIESFIALPSIYDKLN